MESVIEFLENKTILVRGVTGFLAKIFVEKILRVQPNIKKFFLIIRASDQKSVLERLHSEVIETELFTVIKEKYGTNLHLFISEKVMPVAGDITLANFGVNDLGLLNEMKKQVDVVISSAATTSFDERYDMALAVNTFGVEHVSNFANECLNIKLLLHVSTAYVSGEKSGIILETPFKMGETINGKNALHVNDEKKVIEDKVMQLNIEKANEESISSNMKDFGIQRAKLHGWPNTYVFTKAMGEMLLQETLRPDVPLVILRPTMITSTYKEPLSGWIEGVRTVDSFIAAYGRGRTSCFLANPTFVLDMIPTDMVVVAMIVAMTAHINQSHSRNIYHVGSSMSNPMKVSSLVPYVRDYFVKHPIISKQGKPIKVTKRITMLSSMSSFYKYMAIHYMIPLKALKYANIILFRSLNSSYMKANRKFKVTLRLVELFGPYVLTNCIYDDTNLKELLNKVTKSVNAEMETFFFDTKSLDWEEYITNIHVPGVVKYAFK